MGFQIALPSECFSALWTCVDLGDPGVFLLFVSEETSLALEEFATVGAGQLADGGSVVLAVVLGNLTDGHKLVADAADVELALGRVFPVTSTGLSQPCCYGGGCINLDRGG